MSALLVANNIKKYYGSFAAVENVSLTVEKGTIHAIIGENGAGKSTLMNIPRRACTSRRTGRLS